MHGKQVPMHGKQVPMHGKQVLMNDEQLPGARQRSPDALSYHPPMRKTPFSGLLAVVAVMLQVASGHVAAQAAKPAQTTPASQTAKPAAKPAPKVGTIPRLPDGHPDLQ